HGDERGGTELRQRRQCPVVVDGKPDMPAHRGQAGDRAEEQQALLTVQFGGLQLRLQPRRGTAVDVTQLAHELVLLRRHLYLPVCADQEGRSEEHTSELQSRENLVCRLLLEKKKKPNTSTEVIVRQR